MIDLMNPRMLPWCSTSSRSNDGVGEVWSVGSSRRLTEWTSLWRNRMKWGRLDREVEAVTSAPLSRDGRREHPGPSGRRRAFFRTEEQIRHDGRIDGDDERLGG